ncbi:PAP2-domain-containing protein [Sodiomyces alkalinus F11]|uniref:PAP2-domain-containing protein n=1 Tax=Sodiomyces alkalinus (strain CBS 110278 / VKM F-3762 / F11) TaxID=1314773 RepID=A0A3N2PR83_SODAK|nr:PAP2-domain-containing protein [Sodiomyces alkalinus F11]ROT37021.1 PAP2-domain-containing protein [Sodiomyces alkalinus F11]
MPESIPLNRFDLAQGSPYNRMSESYSIPRPSGATRRPNRRWTASLITSYIFDWVILAVAAAVGGVLAIIGPNKRHFSLVDPTISFPFTERETVPVWLLLLLVVLAPAVIILLVCLIFVPGATAPKGTPKSLIWRRKLWELHVGWLGLALAVVAAWFVTSGMKNMFGKPRPDLLSRCEPDLANIERYIVGGIGRNQAQAPSTLGLDQVIGIGTLVSADICQTTDSSKLDEGFRSYPSGHASSSAAGLIYLSLFLASKFAVTIPFVAYQGDAASHSAFPSRLATSAPPASDKRHGFPLAATPSDRLASHSKMVTAIRRQAAAPPLYLLCLVLVPFFLSIFIAGSRWFDYRHHPFDILFGYFIGLLSSIFAFYYYHLPIQHGAGWAWGPRSNDKAWWAGVGSYSYATDKKDLDVPGDVEESVGFRAHDGASTTQIAQPKDHDDVTRPNGHGLEQSHLSRREHPNSAQMGQRSIAHGDQPEAYQLQPSSSTQVQHDGEWGREERFGHAI